MAIEADVPAPPGRHLSRGRMFCLQSRSLGLDRRSNPLARSFSSLRHGLAVDLWTLREHTCRLGPEAAPFVTLLTDD